MFSLPWLSAAAISWQAEAVISPPFWQATTRSQHASKPPSPPVRWIWQSTQCGPGAPQSTGAESGLVWTVQAERSSQEVGGAGGRARVCRYRSEAEGGGAGCG